MRNAVSNLLRIALAGAALTLALPQGQAHAFCREWNCNINPYYPTTCCFEHRPDALAPFLYLDPCDFKSCGVWGVWSLPAGESQPMARPAPRDRPRRQKKQWDRGSR
jgi:hypothetical protein